MNIPFLDLKRMDEELKDALKSKFAEMLEEGIFSGGDEVKKLESKLSVYLNTPFTIACANGTDALELALRALGIGTGDEVIVPAITWVSTAEAVIIVGAKPVFCDTDTDGLLASDWDKAITEKTKAVIPVHLYGKMVDMEGLVSQAKKYNLFIIEDGAQSFGSFQNGKAAGTFGDIGCLSFYPTKNFGALGEAGMCLTNSSELNGRIRLLLNHGQKVRDEHVLVGRNSRIDSIQAGFLNVFIKRFGSYQDLRKKYAQLYIDGLAGIEELQLPPGLLEENHNAHLFVIQTARRKELKSFLMDKGIGTAIHYPHILPDMNAYHCEGNFLNATKLSEKGLSLPLNSWMNEKEIAYIVKAIQDFFA
ncbi:DegT/DnrJ/EryC1/StrS family aminotransferase [Algoriphagus sp. D3-2-R+10]|uniref:DegT/DnrJ/EryC1/StrS family aminotransferase n=1 Tax=Algoriphagus aurantiacus TaxID=3103948 RepID=UPI002B3DA552|nr:DegT/DnrJ/EryC1/StrS family aminotransferase [Algoriphagus sp. D3-2-R+10]MEB2776014.1 DegT/DnrJ/EryC1/StrS family aminotransferase [Algoriphagus sp. D3-2-R+10]